MIHEYLFVNKENYNEVKTYSFKDIRKRIISISNSDCWILRLSANGENADNAQKLSSANQEIVSKYSPIILINESSAYFNKRLYPYINEFERRLRKLLYLANTINNDEKSTENISDLEAKDLGTIFEMLFVDLSFMQQIKENINKKTWLYTKYEILKKIETLEETTIWRTLFGKSPISELESDFYQIKTYRNSVMHAHNIDYETYISAIKLFKKANKQLDLEINKLVGPTEESETVTINTQIFKEAVNKHIKAEQALQKLSKSLEKYERVNQSIAHGRFGIPFQEPISPALIESFLQELNGTANISEYPQALMTMEKQLEEANRLSVSPEVLMVFERQQEAMNKLSISPEEIIALEEQIEKQNKFIKPQQAEG